MNKREAVLELFFNEPTKQWHFEEIIKAAKISRPQAVYWLRKFARAGIIKRIKPRGKMPYYLACYKSPDYQTKKRLFSLSKMEQAGFLKHLTGLPKAQTIIIFGSMSRWDWYNESDIDVFIYGTTKGLEYGKYRVALHRKLQIFVCQNKEDLKKFSPELLQNILEGYRVKGTLDFIEVEKHA